MPKYRYLSLFVIIFALFVVGLFVFKEKFVSEPVVSMEHESIDHQMEMESSIGKFDYVCQSGKNAYEELSMHAQIESKDSSFGPMVTGINGQNQGDGKYWLYAIDGQEATVGASSYLCKGGEQITWELK